MKLVITLVKTFIELISFRITLCLSEQTSTQLQYRIKLRVQSLSTKVLHQVGLWLRIPVRFANLFLQVPDCTHNFPMVVLQNYEVNDRRLVVLLFHKFFWLVDPLEQVGLLTLCFVKHGIVEAVLALCYDFEGCNGLKFLGLTHLDSVTEDLTVHLQKLEPKIRISFLINLAGACEVQHLERQVVLFLARPVVGFVLVDDVLLHAEGVLVLIDDGGKHAFTDETRAQDTHHVAKTVLSYQTPFIVAKTFKLL